MVSNKRAIHPLRIFWFSIILTVALGAWIATTMGLSGLWLFTILVILEITFSFDNAVVNSKILARMSSFWQTLFLTVGIIFAVFIVRFLLPIFIVMLSAGQGFGDVISLALNHPDEYGKVLHHAAPIINAFGGTFLVMLGISYFMDRSKDIHWLGAIERRLSAAGRYQTFKVFIMLIVALVLFASVDQQHHVAVLLASIIGTALHLGLELFGEFFAGKQSNNKLLVGGAAFASFIYLNILDASFSLDGVIGAFAITSSVLLIIAGLGAGALWVRSLTIYLVRSDTLSKYLYLDHGAHWAILALGIVMLAKLYHLDPPEWLTGSLGLVFIATAIISSVIESRRATASR